MIGSDYLNRMMKGNDGKSIKILIFQMVKYDHAIRLRYYRFYFYILAFPLIIADAG